jgi:hypothetical protein
MLAVVDRSKPEAAVSGWCEVAEGKTPVLGVAVPCAIANVVLTVLGAGNTIRASSILVLTLLRFTSQFMSISVVTPPT